MIRLLLSLIALAVAVPALAQPAFPALTGRVVDQAAIIPDSEEAALSARLEALERDTGRQVVVATIADMQGYALSDYGYQLGRAWGIGEKKANNGLVLFLAPNEPAGKRGPRIEVGYGLEPIMTDAVSHVIAMEIMTPMLKAGNIPGALNAGVDAIATQLKLPPDEAAARARALAERREQRPDIPIGAIIFMLFLLLFFILPLLQGRKRRGRRWGGAPVIVWGGSDWGGSDWGGGGSSWGGGGSSWGGGGFSGGGGSFGGGGASGGW